MIGIESRPRISDIMSGSAASSCLKDRKDRSMHACMHRVAGNRPLFFSLYLNDRRSDYTSVEFRYPSLPLSPFPSKQAWGGEVLRSMGGIRIFVWDGLNHDF